VVLVNVMIDERSDSKLVPLVKWSQLKHRKAHLSNLPLRSNGGKIVLLLGLDCAHLVAVIESRVIVI